MTSLVNTETGRLVGIYVLVDAAGQALYVGSSRDIARRVREHRSKSWWPLVADVEVYPESDWDLAKYIERNLIRTINPEFNRQSISPADHAINSMFAPMWRGIAEAFQ